MYWVSCITGYEVLDCARYCWVFGIAQKSESQNRLVLAALVFDMKRTDVVFVGSKVERFVVALLASPAPDPGDTGEVRSCRRHCRVRIGCHSQCTADTGLIRDDRPF